MGLEDELKVLLNKHSRENASHTPDFILAQALVKFLEALEVVVNMREEWYGRSPK